MRLFASLAPVALFTAASGLFAQQRAGSASILPDAPSRVQLAAESQAPPTEIASTQSESALGGFSSSLAPTSLYDFSLAPAGYQQTADRAQQEDQRKKKQHIYDAPTVDENGNPIPLSRQQPKRILGFMPNYRTVAAGAAIHPPGWKYNFQIATRQSFDYSSFIFLGITSLSAEGINSHPALGKGVHGFYSYTWRGLLDKTDGTYLGAFVLASALREDTRYYPLGDGHSILVRSLYVISRQGVARDYTGHNVFNMAGLGGKVLTQYISRSYYPAGTSDLSVLATKFAYASMRDIGFSAIREFYPDIAAHYIRKHREKMAAIAAHDAAAAAANQANPASPVPPKP